MEEVPKACFLLPHHRGGVRVLKSLPPHKTWWGVRIGEAGLVGTGYPSGHKMSQISFGDQDLKSMDFFQREHNCLKNN